MRAMTWAEFAVAARMRLLLSKVVLKIRLVQQKKQERTTNMRLSESSDYLQEPLSSWVTEDYL